MTAEPAGPQPIELRGFYRVPIELIKPHASNIRESLGDLTEMALSIREFGILQPIVVMPDGDGYRILAGHRRFGAALLAKLTHVPVIVRREVSDVDALAVMLVENGQRQNLDPIDEAQAIQALMTRSGMTQVEVGKRIGRSLAHVSMRLSLLTLTAAEQKAIRTGEETVSNGIAKARRRRGAPQLGTEHGWHLSQFHELADQVRALCKTQKHGNGRRVGGVACGECWELCIRSDERRAVRREQTRREPVGQTPPPTGSDVVSRRHGQRLRFRRVREARRARRPAHLAAAVTRGRLCTTLAVMCGAALSISAPDGHVTPSSTARHLELVPPRPLPTDGALLERRVLDERASRSHRREIPEPPRLQVGLRPREVRVKSTNPVPQVAPAPRTAVRVAAPRARARNTVRSITAALWARTLNAVRVANCESGDRHGTTYNGDPHLRGKYSGKWQMDADFWATYGGLQYAQTPASASESEQDAVAYRGWLDRGWQPWTCARIMGVR